MGYRLRTAVPCIPSVTALVRLEGLLDVRLGRFVVHHHFFEAEAQRIDFEKLNGVRVIHLQRLREFAGNIVVIGAGDP